MAEFMDRWAAFVLANGRLLQILFFSFFTLGSFFMSIWMRKNISKDQRHRYFWKGFFLLSVANALIILRLITTANKFISYLMSTLIFILMSIGLYFVFAGKRHGETTSRKENLGQT
jgi:hypothetical protein